MNDSDPDDFLARSVWVLRFVAILLVIGVLVFFGIAVFIRIGPNPPKAALAPPALTFVGLGCAVLFGVLHFILPQLSAGIARRRIAKGTWNPNTPPWMLVILWVLKIASGNWYPSTPEHPIPADELFRMSDAEKLCRVYLSQFALRMALLLTTAVANLTAYVCEGYIVSLVVVALHLILQLLRFPTRHGLQQFVSKQGELLRQAQQAVLDANESNRLAALLPAPHHPLPE
jgi:uncharacterized membrane protein